MYHFVSIKGLAEQEVGRIVLPEIYKKLDIDISITPMPAKRAEREVATGKADGEIMRISRYGDGNPATVRVPTPYYYLQTSAFVKKNNDVILTSIDDLAKYSLVKVRGVKHTNEATVGIEDVHDVESTGQMMRFLRAGRADIALTSKLDGTYELEKTGSTDIILLGKPLAEWKLYHYLHKDHLELAFRVDAVIKEMITSGEMTSLVKKAELSVKGSL